MTERVTEEMIEAAMKAYLEVGYCSPEGMRAALAAALALAPRDEDAANAKALAVARGRALKKCRDMFINIKDELSDEGDRVYFGSTNDADQFKECVDELDSWAWQDIMDEGKIPDVYEAARKANARADAAEAKLAEAVKVIEPFVHRLAETPGEDLERETVKIGAPLGDFRAARSLLARIKGA